MQAEVTDQTQLQADTAHDPDAEVEEALRAMQSGEMPPMQAVLRIREVAENHPGNVKANFTLGVLSIQSGQYDKAVGRFQTVLEQRPEDAQAWRMLAESQLYTGDTVTAKTSFDKALEYADEEMRATFENELPQLN